MCKFWIIRTVPSNAIFFVCLNSNFIIRNCQQMLYITAMEHIGIILRQFLSLLHCTWYIYTTSEKPVNDQSYGVLDRYGITILYK